MAEEIEKFDPSKLMQGVKDRIKATFVSLIPDEQWEQMVQKEINDYFKPITESSGYNYKREVSNFTFDIHTIIKDIVKNKIIEILNQPDFALSWDGNKTILSEVMRERLIKYAPEIFISMLEGSMANAINQLKNKNY